MATAEASAVIRADAMARLSRAAPALARSLGIPPPDPVAGEAAKDPALREARTLESLAAFIDAAAFRAEAACRLAAESQTLAADLRSQLDAAAAEVAAANKRKGR